MKRERDICLDAPSCKERRLAPLFKGIAGSLSDTPGRTRLLSVVAAALAFLPIFGQITGVGAAAGTQLAAPQGQISAQQSPFPNAAGGTDDELSRRMMQKRYEEINAQRQKQLTSDSAKLLVLANELKSQVEKEAGESSSVEEVRKAELIEKLARSVRDKMKSEDGPAQPFVAMPRK